MVQDLDTLFRLWNEYITILSTSWVCLNRCKGIKFSKKGDNYKSLITAQKTQIDFCHPCKKWIYCSYYI